MFLHICSYYLNLLFAARIDDIPRMLKVRSSNNSKTDFEVGTWSVTEREKMLGFPTNYVQAPGKMYPVSMVAFISLYPY